MREDRGSSDARAGVLSPTCRQCGVTYATLAIGIEDELSALQAVSAHPVF